MSYKDGVSVDLSRAFKPARIIGFGPPEFACAKRANELAQVEVFVGYVRVSQCRTGIFPSYPLERLSVKSTEWSGTWVMVEWGKWSQRGIWC